MGRRCRWSFPVVVLIITSSSPAAVVSGTSEGLSQPIAAGSSPLASFPNSRYSSSSTTRKKNCVNPLVRDLIRSLEGSMKASNPILNHSRRSQAHQKSAELSLSPPKMQQASAVKTILSLPPRVLSKLKDKNPPSAGYYYGLMPNKIFPYESSRFKQQDDETIKQLAMAETLSETLEEMRNMRKELQTLRREMYEMRKKITGEEDLEFEGVEEEEVDPEVARLVKLKRRRKYDRIGKEVEGWARKILFDEPKEGNGWVEVVCNKVVRNSYNPDGRTSCYLNWMKDPRGKYAFRDDDREYPIIKVYSTIDAPIEDVCTYLSKEKHMIDYNGILTERRDLEEIAPHSKICWAISPQILFIKPREFVTFVYHRWTKDGTMVLINQACDHKDAPAVTEEGKGKACRAYALRGATLISPHPEDPQKTRMALISHAAPGGSIGNWATKTGINALAPIEPYKLFHRINNCVLKSKPEIEKARLERAEAVAVPGHSNQPVGIAQIGFAAFWPNGGGLLPPAEPTNGDNRGANAMEPQVAMGDTQQNSAEESE